MNRVLVYGMTNNPGGIETYLRNLFRLHHLRPAGFLRYRLQRHRRRRFDPDAHRLRQEAQHQRRKDRLCHVKVYAKTAAPEESFHKKT